MKHSIDTELYQVISAIHEKLQLSKSVVHNLHVLVDVDGGPGQLQYSRLNGTINLNKTNEAGNSQLQHKLIFYLEKLFGNV